MNIYEEFVGFLNAKPKDEYINHSSWESCAVGDFFRSRDDEENYSSPERLYMALTTTGKTPITLGMTYGIMAEEHNRVLAKLEEGDQ